MKAKGEKGSTRVVFGLMLIVIGVALLANQLHLDWAPDIRRLWPVVFYALAVGHLASERGPLLTARVLWFLFLGTIFLLHTHRVLSLRESWPLFVVVAGVALLMDALVSKAGERRGGVPGSSKELR